MCLYPRIMRNPRYRNTAKICIDKRQLWVPVGCGNCIECRKQKAQSWRIRLGEELKVNTYKYFVTLTFSPEALQKLLKQNNMKTECNAIAGKAVRLFLERWRKEHGKSLKHWLITELGHEGTERIHLHGVIFNKTPITKEYLESKWTYGKCDTGKYCNMQTINYIVKYVTKIDKDHKDYKAEIFCSAGIGKNFITTIAAKNTYKYKKGESCEYYTLNNGQRVGLPMYYKNHLYTDEERQKIWSDRLDKNEIWVNGIRIRDISTPLGQQQYYMILQEQQEWNKKIGYGSTDEEWKARDYNITFSMLQHAHTHE